VLSKFAQLTTDTEQACRGGRIGGAWGAFLCLLYWHWRWWCFCC